MALLPVMLLLGAGAALFLPLSSSAPRSSPSLHCRCPPALGAAAAAAGDALPLRAAPPGAWRRLLGAAEPPAPPPWASQAKGLGLRHRAGEPRRRLRRAEWMVWPPAAVPHEARQADELPPARGPGLEEAKRWRRRRRRRGHHPQQRLEEEELHCPHRASPPLHVGAR